MKKSIQTVIRLSVLTLTLSTATNLFVSARAQAGAPPEINRQIGKKAFEIYTHGSKDDPKTNSNTVAFTCEAKLNSLNAYSRCALETNPIRAKGAIANQAMNACLVRMCKISQ